MANIGGGSFLKQVTTFTRVNFVEQAEAIELILQRAVQETLAIQKRLGNPISICKDGKIVIVPPEEIVLSPESSDSEK
jgi:ABC-type proline/glycine betaine transport system ATPase subunit